MQITNKILLLISQIDEFKGKWKGSNSLLPNRLQYLSEQSFAESVRANALMEGYLINLEQVETLISNLSKKNFVEQNEQFAAGYAEVRKLVLDQWEDIHLSENQINQFHNDVFKYLRNPDQQSESTRLNAIIGLDGKNTATDLLQKLNSRTKFRESINWINDILNSQSVHPLLASAIFIGTTQRIKPFPNGNNTICGLLLTLLLFKGGYEFIPYCSLDKVLAEYRNDYEKALNSSHLSIPPSNQNWYPWVEWFLHTFIQSINRLEGSAQRETKDHANLPDVSIQILDCVRKMGRVTIGQVVKSTGVNRNTLKDHFRSLHKANYLTLKKQGRGSWYEIP